MAEQAYQQALQDIKEDCKKNHKSFLAFRSKLNPIMEHLVQQHISAQEKIHYCFSSWQVKTV